jgi:hypothetical protein
MDLEALQLEERAGVGCLFERVQREVDVVGKLTGTRSRADHCLHRCRLAKIDLNVRSLELVDAASEREQSYG